MANEKPLAVQTLCEVFGGQLVGSHFLSEKGLLKRDPNPKDWDVVVPENFFLVSIAYLKKKGWVRQKTYRQKRYGTETIKLDTFEKGGILIDLFPIEEGKIITIADALEHKRFLSKQDPSKIPADVIEKHHKDFLEFLDLLKG